MIEILLTIILFYIIYCNYKETFQNILLLEGYFEQTIYTYIDEKSKPIEKLNIENLKKKLSKEWKLIVLSKENLNNYFSKEWLEFSNKLSRFETIKLISLEIIYQRGGIWIDPQLNILDVSYFDKKKVEMFYQGLNCILLEFKENKYLQYKRNYIIIAPNKSKYLKNVISKFKLFIKLKDSEFINNYLQYAKYFKNIKDNIPNTERNFTKLQYYTSIKLELENNKNYEIFKKNEKSKIIYEIKLSKTNKRDILNAQIYNYKIKNNLFRF